MYVPFEAAKWYVVEKWRRGGCVGDPPTIGDARIEWYKFLDFYAESSEKYWQFKRQFPIWARRQMSHPRYDPDHSAVITPRHWKK